MDGRVIEPENAPVQQMGAQPPAVPESGTEEVLHCAYHPDRETLLRCNRCGQPICYECAVRTPVGYRCRQCVRSQQAAFYTGSGFDLAIAAVVSLVLAAIAGFIASLLLGIAGFFGFILAVLVGAPAGGLIAEAVRAAVGRRRSRNLNTVAAIAALVGVLFLPVLLPMAAALLLGAPGVLMGSLLGRLPTLLFGILAASTIYARLQ